jgi:hypothetical protein
VSIEPGQFFHDRKIGGCTERSMREEASKA